MTSRVNPFAQGNDILKELFTLTGKLNNVSIETGLLELIRLRVSQLNGCAICMYSHLGDARAAGESVNKIEMLTVWRESSFYSPRERAALAWAEALTRVAITNAQGQEGVSDVLYEEVNDYFSPQEQIELTLVIGIINTWNRFGIGFKVSHPQANIKGI